MCAPCGKECVKTIRPMEKEEIEQIEERVKAPRGQEYVVRNPRKLLDRKIPSKKDVGVHNL